jgi:hypothetical protein
MIGCACSSPTPLEEALAMSVPVLGAAYVALMASLRTRRRPWKRD